jgi:4-hydroxy-tetrahydrodipicolinate synthase
VSPSRLFGISPALVSPLDAARNIDISKLVAHADALLKRGAESVTVFGTTGEGTSFSLAERESAVLALIAGGIPAGKIVEGVLECSIDGAAAGVGGALKRGARAVLLAPPFYFRDPDDTALFAWFSEVFKRADAPLRDIFLYHIPGMTGVPLSFDLIARLREAFPAAILGVKDSSGDRAHTFDLLKAHGDLTILVGDERYLGAACAAGAAGSICGIGNIDVARLRRVVREKKDDPAVVALVEAIIKLPVIPAVKMAVALRRGDRSWAAPRPPLAPLNDAQERMLAEALSASPALEHQAA